MSPAQNLSAVLSSLWSDPVDVGLVLGSGWATSGWLSWLTQTAQHKLALPWDRLPGFPAATVAGHPGQLVLFQLREPAQSVAVCVGRLHGYEGHTPQAVTLPIRLFAAMGARHVLLTNAAGGVNAEFQPGEVMAISDHVNLTGQTPLQGPLEDPSHPRFIDMSGAYDTTLAQSAAQTAGLRLQSGVYAGVMGPSYETPAEVRMLRTLGADAVGMSTVWETIMALALGLRVTALSLITNPAAGLSTSPLDHADVLAVGEQTLRDWGAFLPAFLTALATEHRLA